MSAPNSLTFPLFKSTFSEAYLDVWSRVPFGNLEQIVDRVEGLLLNPDLLLGGPTANCASFAHRVARLLSDRYPAIEAEMINLCTENHGAIGWYDRNSKIVFLIDSSAQKMILLSNRDVQRATMSNKVVEWCRKGEDGKLQISTRVRGITYPKR